MTHVTRDRRAFLKATSLAGVAAVAAAASLPAASTKSAVASGSGEPGETPRSTLTEH